MYVTYYYILLRMTIQPWTHPALAIQITLSTRQIYITKFCTP